MALDFQACLANVTANALFSKIFSVNQAAATQRQESDLRGFVWLKQTLSTISHCELCQMTAPMLMGNLTLRRRTYFLTSHCPQNTHKKVFLGLLTPMYKHHTCLHIL